MPQDAVREVLESQQTKFFGKYRGLVQENNDPMFRGRLKVLVPQVLGDTEVYALPCVPYAGKGVGFFAMPEPDTVVWIEFEAGDPSYPIWSGCTWALGDIDVADALPHVKFLKTKKFTIRIDDLLGEVVVENEAGASITLGLLDLTIKHTSVICDASGKKTALTPASFSVNNGALTVL
jgi:hypothetical protein